MIQRSLCSLAILPLTLLACEGASDDESLDSSGGSGALAGTGGSAWSGGGPGQGGLSGDGGSGAAVGGSVGSSGSTGVGGADAQGGSDGSSGSGAGPSGGGGSDTGGASGGGGDAGEGGGEAPAVCTPPVSLVDTTNPDAVVGDGTPESCTEDALRSAVQAGSVITFDCGPDPVTLSISQQIELPNDRDTVIDGAGKVKLDAGGRSRHFYFYSGNWMATNTRVVLQRLVLRNGKAPAGEYFPQDPANPRCAYGYKDGSGGSLFMRDGVLHVIDCQFYDNQAALEGPDVGGGAIYAQGASEVVISGSTFSGNRAANGGAVGMLFANPGIYNSLFENNTAEGVGMNYVEAGCPNFNHDEQGGAGGLAGGVYFDGMNDDGVVYTICGSTFRNNRANELAGALFRTPNVSMRDMLIDRSVFDGNTARTGGVSFIKQNALVVRDTLFTGNRGGLNVLGESVGGGSGGLWVNEGTLDLMNSTFSDNSPGGLAVEGSGTVRNATFAGSRSDPDVTPYNSIFVNVPCETANGAHNLQWPESGTCPGDTVHADPRLGALADNGGPTATLLPASDSPALGIGTDCPSTDQRGQSRPATGCDAGAVEQ